MAAFPPGTHVQVNDTPPWYGQVVSSHGGQSLVRVGGMDTVRSVPDGKLLRHPAFVARRIVASSLALPAKFRIGDHVQVNDPARWYGQIVDWKGGGVYQVRFGGSNLVRDVEEARLELHPMLAHARRVPREQISTGTHVEIRRGGPLLFGQVEGSENGRYRVRVGGTREVITVEEEHLHPLRPAARLRNATFLSFRAAGQLDREKTLVMRAQNTGDMYQVKASMVIHADNDLLLWNVNETTRSQAQQVVDLVGDLLRRPGSRQRVFYIAQNRCPSQLYKTETWTTADIERFVSTVPFGLARQIRDDPRARALGSTMVDRAEALLGALVEANRNPGLADWTRNHFRRLTTSDLGRRYAAYDQDQAAAFDRDLRERGRFEPGRRYVIVNFRATGHSNRPGANAPALDTGLVGVQEIIQQVHDVLGEDVIVVPMGEEPRSMLGGPNLLNYWTWPSAGDRGKQAALLRYLRDHYRVVGAIGMRSGVMDQIALSGIPIISIDISPHRYHKKKGLPDLSTSKGWDRGLKLEDAFGAHYGRVFLHHHRKKEARRGLEDWPGAFHEEDLTAIRDSVGFYFSGASREGYRHRSHPFHPEQMSRALDPLRTLMEQPYTGYDLVDHFHPYVSHLSSHGGLLADRVRSEIRRIKKLVEERTQKLELLAHSEITNKLGGHPIRTIKWMRDNQKRALLEGNEKDPWYRQQLQWLARELKVEDENRALSIYLFYHHRYGEQRSP